MNYTTLIKCGTQEIVDVEYLFSILENKKQQFGDMCLDYIRSDEMIEKYESKSKKGKGISRGRNTKKDELNL